MYAVNNWNNAGQDAASNSLSKLFYYNDGTQNVRVRSYKLNSISFKDLMVPGGTPNNQLGIVTTAAKRNPIGTITDTPAFNFVAYAYYADPNDASPNNENILWPSRMVAPGHPLTHVVSGSQPAQTTRAAKRILITKTEADIIREHWDSMSDMDFDYLFKNPNNGDKLVTGYLFGSEDVEDMIECIGDLNTANPEFYVHCGALPNQFITGEDPYHFRPVLQISHGPADADNHYFEFGSPCPPNCKKYIKDPLEIPALLAEVRSRNRRILRRR